MQYLPYYQRKIHEKQYLYMIDLCSKAKHWFPRFLIEYGLLEVSIRTSNGIESFFTGLKKCLQHKRENIDQLFILFILLSIKKLQKLLNKEEHLIKKKIKMKDQINLLITKYHFPKELIESIGGTGFNFLMKQVDLNCYTNTIIDLKYATFSDPFCFQCYCQHEERNIPCVHKMLSKISIAQFYKKPFNDLYHSFLFQGHPNSTLEYTTEDPLIIPQTSNQNFDSQISTLSYDYNPDPKLFDFINQVEFQNYQKNIEKIIKKQMKSAQQSNYLKVRPSYIASTSKQSYYYLNRQNRLEKQRRKELNEAYLLAAKHLSSQPQLLNQQNPGQIPNLSHSNHNE